MRAHPRLRRCGVRTRDRLCGPTAGQRTHSGPAAAATGPAVPRLSLRTHAAVDAIVYKFVGAQIEDGRDQGQEGAPRRGGGPRGRPLHHCLAPDGATYVLYIYFGVKIDSNLIFNDS